MSGSSEEHKLGTKLRDMLLGRRPDYSVGVLVYPGGEKYESLKESLEKETRNMLASGKSAQEISDYRSRIVGEFMKPIAQLLERLGVSYTEFPLGGYIAVDRISRANIYDRLLPDPDIGRLEYRRT